MTEQSCDDSGHLKTHMATPGLAPVRRAHEQIADQLRSLIVRGELQPGDRLPNEVELARTFRVSRTTVREALQVLQVQNLLETGKGSGRGSRVTLPTVDRISAFVHASVDVLAQSQHVTLEELLEARQIVEGSAVALAADRRTDMDVERLRASIPGDLLRLDTRTEFAYNSEFHLCVLEASGNALLSIAAQPIFTVLQTNITRSTHRRHFQQAIHKQHRIILEAIEAGDAGGASTEMRDHLEFLRPHYEKVWRHVVKREPSSA